MCTWSPQLAFNTKAAQVLHESSLRRWWHKLRINPAGSWLILCSLQLGWMTASHSRTETLVSVLARLYDLATLHRPTFKTSCSCTRTKKEVHTPHTRCQCRFYVTVAFGRHLKTISGYVGSWRLKVENFACCLMKLCFSNSALRVLLRGLQHFRVLLYCSALLDFLKDFPCAFLDDGYWELLIYQSSTATVISEGLSRSSISYF